MSKEQFLLENQRAGEQYAGLILGKEGKPDYHVFLLGAKPESIMTWSDALEWARTVGGQLPNRSEQSLLFANLKELFNEFYYWSSEQRANNTNFAWAQDFSDGFQGNDRKSNKGRARAVRRVILDF